VDQIHDGGAVADVRDEAKFFGFLVHELLDDAEGAYGAGGFTEDGAGENYIRRDVWMCFVEREDTVKMVSTTVAEVA